MAIQLTDDNFEELVMQSGLPAVIDFGAEWCGPCKALAPIIDELAEEYNGKVVIAKADVEECAGLSARFRVRNVPTVLFIKNGEVKDKSVGAVQKTTLVEKINAIL